MKIWKWNRRANGCASIGRWPVIMLISVGTQTVALLPLQAATPKQPVTDSGITSAVEGD